MEKKKRIFTAFGMDFLQELEEAEEIQIDSLGRVHGLEDAFKRAWRRTGRRS